MSLGPDVSLLNDAVYRSLVAARVNLLFDEPRVGQLLARLALVDASDQCPTVATDGRNIFYNRDFVERLPKPELIVVLTDLVVASPHAEEGEG